MRYCEALFAIDLNVLGLEPPCHSIAVLKPTTRVERNSIGYSTVQKLCYVRILPIDRM